MTENHQDDAAPRDGGAGAKKDTPDDRSTDRGNASKKQPSQVQLLADLLVNAQGFQSARGDDDGAYVSLIVGAHRETWPVPSKSCRAWMSRAFLAKYETVPAVQSVTDAMSFVEGLTLASDARVPVFVRIAEHEGAVYLDLCDEPWRVARVDPAGWRVIPGDGAPVRFVRRKGMMALPEPERGGSVELLRRLVNLPDDEQWVLAVGALVGMFNPTGPYPILIVNGEQGSAKSTLCRMLRGLVDPHTAPLRRPPRDPRDLFIAARNAWVQCLDNLSGIRTELGDCLCSLVTDGGFATRLLYTDDEEAIFRGARPVMLNGIDDLAGRPDVLDRAVILHLRTIPEGARRDEASLERDYERVRPRVLGALLDAVSAALRNRDKVRPTELPRMADFALWVTAAEEALGWKGGRFLAAYNANRKHANELAVEASAIGDMLKTMIRERQRWEGIASDLLNNLNILRGSVPEPSGWPKNPKALANALRRLAPGLRSVGISVSEPHRPEGREKQWVWRLEWKEH